MQDRIHGWAKGGLLSGGAAGPWTTRSREDLTSGVSTSGSTEVPGELLCSSKFRPHSDQ